MDLIQGNASITHYMQLVSYDLITLPTTRLLCSSVNSEFTERILLLETFEKLVQCKGSYENPPLHC